MYRETGCLSCKGTGTILAPPRDDKTVAHDYGIVCGCGILCERIPQFAYRAGMILPFVLHRQEMAMANGWVAWVDAGLKNDIEKLWMAGIETVSSCQENPLRMIMICDEPFTETARKILGWAGEVRKNGSNTVLSERISS